ncbi:MAG: septum formation initiator family protein [Coriobacteriia bacterium]|nr:septum formation initiator family protein [Coriobacteriia bacterium]
MRKKRKTAPGRKSTGSRFGWAIPVVALLIAVVFVASYYPVARVQYHELREKAQLEAQLKAVQDRNARLKSQVASLETTAGVEEYARSELGMVMQGENAVIVVDSSTGTSTASAAKSSDADVAPGSEQPIGPWTAFLDLVFGVE